MSGTEDLTLPDLRRAAPGTEPPRKIGAGRISRVVEEVSVPGLPEHLVMVNVGRPYRLEEGLDGSVSSIAPLNPSCSLAAGTTSSR